MIIVLKAGATQAETQVILDQIQQAGLKPLFMPGVERIVIGAIGDERILQTLHFERFPQVEKIKPILSPYKLVSREMHPHNTQVRIGQVTLGGPQFTFIAGPDLIASEAELAQLNQALAEQPNTIINASFYSHLYNQYDFSGLAEHGLSILQRTKMARPVCSEVTETAQVWQLHEDVDAFVIGPNNMNNFALLKAVAETQQPIILTRNHSATLDELLLAAEYLVVSGNDQIVLREQGIKGLDNIAPCSIDFSALARIKQVCHLPVIADLSIAAANHEMVAPLARAAAALGVDGLMLRVQPMPADETTGCHNSLCCSQLQQLVHDITPFIEASGHTL